MRFTIYNRFMPFSLKLAWKYFRSARKGLVRFTSFVAVTAIAAGVASLIISQALTKGFSDEISKKILSNTAHIAVSESGEAKISNWDLIRKRIEKIEGVERVVPAAYKSAVVSSGERSEYAVIKVTAEKSGAVDRKSGDRPGGKEILVSLGVQLAKKLKLNPGDEVQLLTIGQDEKPESSTARVEALFETGLYEYDSTWVTIAEPEYLRMTGSDIFSPTVFNVFVADPFAVEKTTNEIAKALGSGVKILDWRKANEPLFAALSLEKKVSFAIILLIIFIAVLNIATTLTLLINERKLDIAILRTCGARAGGIISVFLLEGSILTLMGTVCGVILGIGTCWIGNYFRIIRLSAEVYSINTASFHVEFSSVIIISMTTFLLSFVSILFPAVRASKIKPLENIRTN
ncbi:MAG: ABC transporter permease [Acidobacteria bacterium]|nr:ABC transporter permease [Acidobacteriota bacterium]